MKRCFKRRQFIRQGGMLSIASLISGHLCLGGFENSPHGENELIKELRLRTATEIPELVHFYHEKLGFDLLDSTNIECTFQTGNSTLTFLKSGGDHSPFYHFAFNIPENKIKAAEKWHHPKSQFIKPPSHLLDKSYQSDNIVHFRHWDAHSLFFYDPAGNVVEYIARHTLNNQSSGEFSTSDILYLSEIGLVVDDVYETSMMVSNASGLKQYSEASDNFLALGDHFGLVIFFKKDTLGAFRQGKPRQTFATEITIKSILQNGVWQPDDYPFVIRN